MSYWPDGNYHRTCHHQVYYLSCEQFEQLWEYANGRCQCCGLTANETPQGQLGIDHDHRREYGDVRGLLCSKCNSAMRYIDNGHRAPNESQQRYLDDAWHLRHPPVDRQTFLSTNPKRTARPRHDNPHRSVRVDGDDWDGFKAAATAAGTDRGAEVNAFIRWYLRRPGAKLPRRPPAP